MQKRDKWLIFAMVVVLAAGLAYLNVEVDQIAKSRKEIEKQLRQLGDAYAELKEKPTEVIRREVIRQKSQEELLTAAVSKVAPAVVSITITKNVPQLEVVYINPFGNDPFFKDFDIRVPQYRQKGTVEKKVGAGTGFIISSRGFIVTNRHVVQDENAHYTVLLSDGKQKPAAVVYRNKQLDLAVLKIEAGNYPVVRLGDSDKLKLGQSVFTVGNALGEYNNSVSVGIISGLHRNLEALTREGMKGYQGIIQTDAAINHGNSGGPLATLRGEVVGINVARADIADNIGFAIPINVAKAVISGYLAK